MSESIITTNIAYHFTAKCKRPFLQGSILNFKGGDLSSEMSSFAIAILLFFYTSFWQSGVAANKRAGPFFVSRTTPGFSHQFIDAYGEHKCFWVCRNISKDCYARCQYCCKNRKCSKRKCLSFCYSAGCQRIMKSPTCQRHCLKRGCYQRCRRCCFGSKCGNRCLPACFRKGCQTKLHKTCNPICVYRKQCYRRCHRCCVGKNCNISLKRCKEKCYYKGCHQPKSEPLSLKICNCKVSRNRGGLCYYYISTKSKRCKKRRCQRMFECTFQETGLTCIKRIVTHKIVRIGPDTCKNEKTWKLMYVPYSSK